MKYSTGSANDSRYHQWLYYTMCPRKSGPTKNNTKLEFRGSRLTRLLYSQNIQRGPPLVGVSWKWPEVTFYMSILINYCIFDFFFVISQLKQICKWGIKYVHLVMTDHMGSTCAHHLWPSFIHVAHTEIWIFFFVISQSEQICKWGIKYAHSVMTDHVGSTCAPHYPYTKFDKNRSLIAFSLESEGLPFDVDEINITSVHTYIHTSVVLPA